MSALWALAACAAVLATGGALAAHGGDSEVTVGSNDLVFSQNKQNEPALAVDPANPSVLAAGANDNIDLEACNAGSDTTCPFTNGVGVTGTQFSLDGGDSWSQPTYTGFSARGCLGVPGPDPDCSPTAGGPIGTLPWYFEEGLISDGDPITAFGPRPDASGNFSWANGSRLYFSNLTSNFPGASTFKGFEAIAVSRTDDPAAAAAGDKAAWKPPVIASTKTSSADFSDKEQVWADNAESSPHFGNVYVCWVEFRSLGFGGAPEPVLLARSTDGGETYSAPRVLSEASNTAVPHVFGRQGCTVRTDSDGVVYVFWIGSDPKTKKTVHKMARSFDGGVRFHRPRPVATVEDCGRFDRATGRLSFDGVAGARTNSFASVDIANGAPSGVGAPDTIVMTWCDGPTPTSTSPGPNEQALVQWSTDKGETWSGPVNAAPAGDRPDFPAIAISPDGKDVYLTYMNFLQPWQSSALAPPRLMQGVVRHADVGAAGPGAFADLLRAATGDARGSGQNNLVAEFLGDYNYAVATNSYGAAVWNDVRDASDCLAMDTFRQNRLDGVTPNPTPAPQQDCAPTFGNTDIFGASFADPTP